MSSPMRTYDPVACAVFWKTGEPLGELSNMASGYPLVIAGATWHTTEALYQACRFPHVPEIQQILQAERSAMAAKMRSKPYRDQSRSDWEAIRARVMRWCLRLKFDQHRDTFGATLLATSPRLVVERSSRDRYWGAVLDDDGLLRGENVLGRLLQEVREEALAGTLTHPPAVPDVPGFALATRDLGTPRDQLDLFDSS